MVNVTIQQHISNLILLEERIGSKIDYRIRETPFLVDQADIISLQSVAKKIAESIGLHGLTFVVAVAKQKEKVAGHIELRANEREVFVEVSEDVLKYKDSILATLAHEITHKYLQINGISLPDEKLNEILTDTASVYLGFGRIMLNGCENYTTRHEKSWNSERTITETLTTGYLKRDELAFVYKLVCSMRNIPPKEYEGQLSREARQALDDSVRQYSEYFNTTLNSKNALAELIKELLIEIRQFQYLLSNIEKNISYIQQGGISTVENFLEKTHRNLSRTIEDTKSMVSDECLNPALNYLNIIVSKEEIVKRKAGISEYISQAKSFHRFTKKLEKTIRGASLFPKPSSNMFNTVICWNDRTKLRLPLNVKRLISKCPKCSYQFAADTTIYPIKVHIKKKLRDIFIALIKKIRSLYH